MSSIFKLIGLGIIAILAFTFVFFFFWFFLAMMVIMVGIFAVAWVSDIPIVIKQNGVKIGYLKRTKFYRE